MIGKVSAFQALETRPAVAAAMEAAELVVACLEKAGVEYVFGVPGGAVEPLYNALARSARRGGPRPVVARHESGAAFMADGYARETGRLGVCVSTSGPGATNLVTGVACAYENRVPLLAITGQPALPSFGRGALQESSCTGVDVVGMLGHCTRYNSLVSHVEQVETKLVNAMLHALRKPHGPAHLSIPVDILRSPVLPRYQGYDLSDLVRRRPSPLDERSVSALEAELAAASRPVFLLGDGAAEAADAILDLARLVGALFVTTPDGKGLVNPYHVDYRGVFGLGGHASAERALREEADLVVAFGTGFGEFASAGWSRSLMNDRLVHVDENEENLFRTPMARLHVHGRMRAICERVAASWRTHGRPCRAALDGAAPGERGYGVLLQSPEGFHSETAPVKPQRLMKELSSRFPPTTRFLADAGNSMIWAAHYLQPWNRRGLGSGPERTGTLSWDRRSGTANWLRIALDFAPMGWAIGAAVGMARANPRCPVVCITGDGSWLMNGQEITTAAEEGLTVVFVVLNDHAYGMVRHGQRMAGAEPVAHDLPRVDFRALAESMGIPGRVIASPGDFDGLDIEAMLARKGPSLLDVRIDREEAPPMALRLRTLGSVKASPDG